MLCSFALVYTSKKIWEYVLICNFKAETRLDVLSKLSVHRSARLLAKCCLFERGTLAVSSGFPVCSYSASGEVKEIDRK
jgi:hypothetical protein